MRDTHNLPSILTEIAKEVCKNAQKNHYTHAYPHTCTCMCWIMSFLRKHTIYSIADSALDPEDDDAPLVP